MKRERQNTQRVGMGQKTSLDIEAVREHEQGPEKKKLDLSAAQIAGSSLATVAAALLASQMGVYGTILGAGVVSVVATAGGPVIQHFFRRTGDQLRESARPKARQVPVVEPREERAPDGTMMLRAVPAPVPPGRSEEFGEGTVHGSRVRGWKRTAVASAVAFAIAIGGIATWEAVSGKPVSRGGTPVYGAGWKEEKNSAPRDGTDLKDKGGQKDGPSRGPGGSPSPSTGPGSPSPDPGGSPTPSHSPSPSPDATPSPSPSKPTPGPTPSPGKDSTGGSGTGSGQDPAAP